jgi:hypothetical protein
MSNEVKVVREYIDSLSVKEVINYRFLSFAFLESEKEGKMNYLLLDEAIERGEILIEEVEGGGYVNFLDVENRGESPVLLIFGEEIKGGKQNRILSKSVLINKRSKLRIPVTCTERGRWSYRDHVIFEPSRYRAPSPVLNEFMKSIEERAQSETWNILSIMANTLNVDTETEAMAEIYRTIEDEIIDMRRNIEVPEGSQAVLVTYHNLGQMDGFGKGETLKKLWQKLLSGYVATKILKEPEKMEEGDVQKILEGLKDLKFVKKKSIGLGYDVSFRNGNVKGEALVHKNEVVHLYISFSKGFEEKNEGVIRRAFEVIEIGTG